MRESYHTKHPFSEAIAAHASVTLVKIRQVNRLILHSLYLAYNQAIK